jgi:hypothetical protein
VLTRLINGLTRHDPSTRWVDGSSRFNPTQQTRKSLTAAHRSVTRHRSDAPHRSDLCRTHGEIKTERDSQRHRSVTDSRRDRERGRGRYGHPVRGVGPWGRSTTARPREREILPFRCDRARGWGRRRRRDRERGKRRYRRRRGRSTETVREREERLS